jgi:CRISPR-associated protein Cas5d
VKTRYPNIVEFEVTGDYALFSDPITRVGGEKCSYPVPTYEALKGIISSVYWKPTFIWIIDKVRIMNPIQMEVKGIRNLVYSAKKKSEQADLSYYTYLKNCCYQVQAHFEWNDNRPELTKDRNENKHHNRAKRGIERGGRRDVFLGTRECQAYVAPCAFGEGEGAYDSTPMLNFGIMVHGITYPDEVTGSLPPGEMTVRLWQPVMEKGVIEFIRPEECTMLKSIGKRAVLEFSEDRNNFTPINHQEGGDS